MSGGYGDGSCAEVRAADVIQDSISLSLSFLGIRGVLPLLHKLLRIHHQPEYHLPPEPRLPLGLLHSRVNTVRIHYSEGESWVGLVSSFIKCVGLSD